MAPHDPTKIPIAMWVVPLTMILGDLQNSLNLGSFLIRMQEHETNCVIYSLFLMTWINLFHGISQLIQVPTP
jgi:hypothetical protein